MNIRNYGVVEGRLVKDPVIFTNNDGSRKVMLTVAVMDNFKSKDGKKGSQFVQLEAFVSAKQTGNGVYGYMHKGDLVGLEFTIRTNNYTDKAGNPVYSQVLLVQGVDLKESKTTTDARQAKAAADADQNAAPAPAPAAEAANAQAESKDELPFG